MSVAAAPSTAMPAAAMARGACPALDAPMLTGDGLLARITVIDMLSPSQLSALCELSQRHGNGILDISARGNLQIRGLTDASAIALEADVRALDLPLREGLAVEWSPLAGLDPNEDTDPRPIGAAIIAEARAFRGRLAPKLSVVIETGGFIRLDHLLADIRMVAEPDTNGLRWRILLGGTAATGRPLGLVTDAAALELIRGLLGHLSQPGSGSRGRDLEPANLPASLQTLFDPCEAFLPKTTAPPFGILALSGDLHAVRVALPFGQMQAGSLAAIASAAETLGISGLRPAPDHALIAFGPDTACQALLAVADVNDFVTRGHDPLIGVSACPGAPSCRSAHIRTHSIGRYAAGQDAALLDGSVRLHLSGCLKGCAHPTAATLAFAGTENATHLVFEGKTTDTPLKRLALQTEAEALNALSALMRLERRPGETSRDCLRRLGPDRIAAALA